MIYRLLNILVLFGCIYWFVVDAGPEPIIVFITGIAAFFRDEIHGVIGFSFISLVPRSRPVRKFKNYKYSFIDSEYINPAIIEDLNGWISDVGDQVVSINISDSNRSNRYSGEIVARQVNGEYPVIEYKYEETSINYQYIGCSFSGVHILRLTTNYGGSGFFGSLILVTVSSDMSVEFEKSRPVKKERLLIKKVGSIPLGDRYNGKIQYKYGIINIPASEGIQTLRDKRERIFVW